LLKKDTSDGWTVTGHPYPNVKTPAHEAFLSAYRAK
jgi:branched-chain amino acid transport system substrate-binding protein